MTPSITLAQWVLGTLLVASSLGVLFAKKPVYASLSFLLTLLSLAALYLQLSAQFIAVMQVLVYAGAILVIFMFVMILFQDAHQNIDQFKPRSSPFLLLSAGSLLLVLFIFLGMEYTGITTARGGLPKGFGTVQSLGIALYEDFFFPFEAVTLMFIVAVVGALYIAKKD